MKHKHHVFQVLDKMPKDKRPEPLDLYLRGVMMYYVAQNKLQREMKGDEMDYIHMLTEEYANEKKE